MQPFILGVIEGFYGRPWNLSERRRLVGWMRESGLGAYLYAPKDDIKHRALWRERYDQAEAEALRDLAGLCREHGVDFVYAIAPGLNIRYADEGPALQGKIEQILALGVRSFAVLFDDIPRTLRAEDAARFGTFAAAQSCIANELFGWLRSRVPNARLWFCPTIYCGRFAGGPVADNAYLLELGAALDREIDVLWTGPEIVPETIPVESIREVRAVLRRPPLIWDNLHANDYDLRRLYLGPFSGRDPALRAEVRGILSNPNCEFEANFVPLHTLGAYCRAAGAWDEGRALAESARAWLPSFATRTGRPFAQEDLDLLIDLFYLPYSAGPRAERLIADFDFLIHSPKTEWGGRLARFERTADHVADLFVKITELADRELCFVFYRLMWEMQAEIKLMRGYLKLLQSEAPQGSYSPQGHHDLRIYRGGVAARLQRLMPMPRPGEFRAS